MFAYSDNYFTYFYSDFNPKLSDSGSHNICVLCKRFLVIQNHERCMNLTRFYFFTKWYILFHSSQLCFWAMTSSFISSAEYRLAIFRHELQCITGFKKGAEVDGSGALQAAMYKIWVLYMENERPLHEGTSRRAKLLQVLLCKQAYKQMFLLMRVVSLNQINHVWCSR